ncbi:MAG: alpha/beta fold hydrolase [Candidatus Protistobacter heckmanni]|nr:alpha/beta fold hydrolase [Candidatus Protistobacter heckmanni]
MASPYFTMGRPVSGHVEDIVLIHGAWQGAWVWNLFKPVLTGRGWRVHAVDLPGNGMDQTPPEKVSLDLYVEHVGKLLQRLPGKAVVVGHSGGGIVASQLAEAFPERIASLVYVAGLMLPSGVTFASLVRRLAQDDPSALGIHPYVEFSADGLTSRVQPGAAQRLFLHDCPADVADAWAARLKPQPERGRAVAPMLTEARYGSVPRIYIEPTRDQSITPRVQHLLQALSPGATRVTIDSGHAPQISQPKRLADAMTNALAALDIGPAALMQAS